MSYKNKFYSLKSVLIIFIFFILIISTTHANTYGSENYGKGLYGIGESSTSSSNGSTGSSGGSGTGSGGGGTPSTTPKPECTNSGQCSSGLVCRTNKCMRLFDVKLIYVDSSIPAGSYLDFSYLIKDISEVSDDVVVDFLLEDFETGDKVSVGRETVFVSEGSEKIYDSRILLPSSISGLFKLTVKVSYEEYSASAIQTLEVLPADTKIKTNFTIYVSGLNTTPNNKINASILIFSNTDEEESVSVKVSITNRSGYLSEKSGNYTIVGKLDLTFTDKELSEGTYTFTVLVNHSGEITKYEQEIIVGDRGLQFMTIDLLILSVGAVLIALIIISILIIRSRRFKGSHHYIREIHKKRLKEHHKHFQQQKL